MKFLILFLLMSSFAMAGGREGGGGSMVLKNGRWQIADKFIFAPAENGEYLILSKGMREFMAYVQKLSSNFLPKVSSSSIQMPQFFADILDPSTQYIFVKQLPCEDDPIQLPYYYGNQVAFGCTKEGITYLLKKKFFESKNNEGDLEEQALKLIHERLHAWVDNHDIKGISHEDIAKLVGSIAFMIQLDREQKDVIPKRRMLNPLEINILQSFWTLSDKLELFIPKKDKEGASSSSLVMQELKVHPNGGGVLLSSKQDIQGYNWNSMAYTNSPKVKVNSTFLSVDSRLYGAVIAFPAVIQSSTLSGTITVRYYNLSNVKWDTSPTVRCFFLGLGSGEDVVNSTLNGTSFLRAYPNECSKH